MTPDLLFYDGGCGLCHRTVVFVLRHDPDGHAFRFAPLGGETFEQSVPAGQREGLPDSIVVCTATGRTLVRSEAVIHIGERLGGGWRFLSRLARLVPRMLRDAAYDGIARIRFRLFARPAGVCPAVPPGLRSRFLA